MTAPRPKLFDAQSYLNPIGALYRHHRRDRLAMQGVVLSRVFAVAIAVLAVLLMMIALATAETIDEARAAAGLPPLRVSAEMTKIADGHARDMAAAHRLSHDGFMERRGPAGALAENVTVGCKNAICAIQRLLDSPPHRRNILLRNARTYGISYARTAKGRHYWAMEIGP